MAIAAGAVGGSQLGPFMAQYLSRSGERLSQAQSKLLSIQTGLKYQMMSETVRGDLAADASADVAALKAVHDPIATSGVVTRPFSLWRNADPAILDQTVQGFVPALPTASDAIVYAIVGLVIAFLAYEVLRWPVVGLATQPPRRRFKRKG